MKISEFTLSDLAVGQNDEINVKVSAELVDRFAEISGDYSPLHMDDLFAKKKGFPSRIAHGMLIGALISGFIGNRLPGRFGILQNIDIGFRKPLFPPDTIQIKGEITNISESVGQVIIKITVADGQGELLATAKVKTIVREG